MSKEIIDINGVSITSHGLDGKDFYDLGIDGKIYYHMRWSEEFLRTGDLYHFMYNFRKEMDYRHENIKKKYCE